MIKSKSKKLKKLVVPIYTKDKELTMLPIDLSGNNQLPTGFKKYKKLVEEMIEASPVKMGIAYLTIHEKKVKKGKTHRRGGAHIDGNYVPTTTMYDNSHSWGGSRHGTDWKVGGDGKIISKEGHIRSYEQETGGMLIVSTHSLCKGWNGTFRGKVRTGGDCSHLNLGEGFKLKPNTLYLGNSQFLHESLQSNKTIKRVMVRITLPEDSKILN